MLVREESRGTAVRFGDDPTLLMGLGEHAGREEASSVNGGPPGCRGYRVSSGLAGGGGLSDSAGITSFAKRFGWEGAPQSYCVLSREIPQVDIACFDAERLDRFFSCCLSF